MKIVLASSEVFPFSKSGGLADVVGSLGRTLGELGHQVEILTPYYRCVMDQELELDPESWVSQVTLNGREVFGAVRKLKWQKNVSVLFLEHEAFYDRPGLYGENGKDYEDNAARFIFLTKALWHWVRYGSTEPDIVHVHDWQTALFPVIWQHNERDHGLAGKKTATVLTIHNLAYQGVFPSHQFPLTELPWDYYQNDKLEFFGQWNCLKAGILYSDELTTVSPQYAREIQTEELGCSLDGVLAARKDHLTGVMNGVDYSEWNTTDNPTLPLSYSADSLGIKTRIKKRLQKETGLPETNHVPLFANIGRIAEQKGMDILVPSLRILLESGTPMQFIQLGTGDPVYEEQLRELSELFPQKVSVHLKYDHAMAHRIEAGADFFVMPSRFEPCGLNQLYSLRYGTIPIVRATGGLHDSIVDYSENLSLANGFKFSSYTIDALQHVLKQATLLYKDRYIFTKYRKQGMECDFSLKATATSYLQIYQKALDQLSSSKA